MIPLKSMTWRNGHTTNTLTGYVGNSPVATIEYSTFSRKYELKLRTIQGTTQIPIGNTATIEQIKKTAFLEFSRYLLNFFKVSSVTDAKILKSV